MNNGFTDRYVNDGNKITNASHSWLDFQKIKNACGVGEVIKTIKDNKNCLFSKKRQ